MTPHISQLNNMPREMKAMIRWLNWKLIQKVDKPKPDKVPFSAKTLKACDPTDSENFYSFEEAYKTYSKSSNGMDGCGFSLAKSIGITAIDLDDCLDENDDPKPWAQKILNLLPRTFIEKSQSGKGLHIFLWGLLPGKGKKKHIEDGALEMYDDLRFIATTGKVYQDAPLELADGQAVIDALCKEYFKSDEPEEDFQIEGPVGNHLTNEELLEKMFGSTNGKKIRALWEGSLEGHRGDHSSADMALLQHLAFWTNRDADRMETLFNESELSKRDKWQQRSDYPKRSIREAIRKCKQGYNPTSQSGTSLVRYESIPELAPYEIQHAPFEDRQVRPNELALRVISKYRIVTDRKENSYLFNEDKIWELLDDIMLEALAASMDTISKTSSKRCSEAVTFTKLYSLKRKIPWRNIKPTEIPFKNGVLDITELSMRVAQPEDYLETLIPHIWEPTAECPEFLKFLQNAFALSPEPEQLIQAIFEFIGYTLMQSAPYKKALLCVGPSNTGKTTLEKVLVEVVGKDNICSIPVERMSSASELAPIKGKMLNVVGEIKTTAMLDDDGFKKLVSIEEPVPLNEKYKPREAYTPFAKHAIFTNHLPTITDGSDAVFNRLLLVSFDNVIPPSEQDPMLSQKLSQEMPGILVQAVKALKGLIERKGQFTMANTSKKLIQQYKQEQNPMYDFLESCFEEDPTSYVAMETVRQALYAYLPKAKRWSHKAITQMLEAAECQVKHTTRKNKQAKYLIGYKLNSEMHTQLVSRGFWIHQAEEDVY